MPAPPDALSDAADVLFAEGAAHGTSLALVVQQHGQLLFERYGVQPARVFGPGGPVDAATPLTSWSMAKSITHAAVGVAVADGLLDVTAPASVPEWRGTEKEAITLQHLLEMRPGLLFVEDYVDDSVSHCLEMLFGAGKQDMAAYAASLPLIAEPSLVWNYSSGTTNIVSRILGDALTAEAAGASTREAVVRAFLHDRLFEPVGMTSADPRFDPAGTFIGSSYVYATARDFARFGQLYLDGGSVDGRRILPEGWADHARELTATDPEGEFDYGRHWWLWRDDRAGDSAGHQAFGCHGYEGQYTVVVPDRDLVVVHLGKSPVDQRPPLIAQLRQIIDAFGA
jgi:CubicO group peptidase (beta-lactamase class C family)